MRCRPMPIRPSCSRSTTRPADRQEDRGDVRRSRRQGFGDGLFQRCRHRPPSWTVDNQAKTSLALLRTMRKVISLDVTLASSRWPASPWTASPRPIATSARPAASRPRTLRRDAARSELRYTSGICGACGLIVWASNGTAGYCRWRRLCVSRCSPSAPRQSGLPRGLPCGSRHPAYLAFLGACWLFIDKVDIAGCSAASPSGWSPPGNLAPRYL